jgi:ABC-2 type transport system ATP-binding protein
MTDPIVSAHQLTKKFGDFTAVDHVTFDIFPKEVIGYLGPNGSGKTTTIRMLLGLLLPTKGYSVVAGYDSVKQTEEVRSNVGYMSQKFALYEELSVWENISFYAGVYGVKDEKYIRDTLHRLGLSGHEKEVVADLPIGWRQRLALAAAIVHSPKVLFLDEPTSGVDPVARRLFWDLIYDLVDDGITALVTTHYMDEAEYCQKVGIMRKGELLALDSPESLKKTHFTGKAWNVYVPNILEGLSAFENNKTISRFGLAGNHLRIIAPVKVTEKNIAKILKGHKITEIKITTAEPSLEDIFLTLAD